MDNSCDFADYVIGIEDYRATAVLLLLVREDNRWGVVLLRRSNQIRQAGEICLPGGIVECGHETALEGALREAKEELGLAPEDVKIFGRMPPLLAPLGVRVDCFLGVSAVPLSACTINKAEVAEVFSMPLDFFRNTPPTRHSVLIRAHPRHVDKRGAPGTLLPVKELGLPSQYKKPWGRFEYPVYCWQSDHGPIWGITARLLKEFLKRHPGTPQII